MATDPTIAANQAKQNQIYEDMLEYAKQQGEVDYARNMGSFVAGEGIRAAGNAGVAAINYLGDWQKINDNKELSREATRLGLDDPMNFSPDLSGYGNNPSDDNWGKVNDLMNGEQPDEMSAAEDLMNTVKAGI